MKAIPTPPVSLEQMVRIAYLAGAIIKQYFTHFGMERIVKTDTTPVTAADKEVNKLVIEKIREISTSVDIIGEEESDSRDNSWQVVCDPVDGTFPYTWGMPLSTFMLGLLYERTPVAGVIYDPFMDRMYYSQRGQGAWLKSGELITPLKVSGVSSTKDRPVVGYVSWPGCPYNILRACLSLEEQGITVVNFCSVGYIEAAVATGEFAATLFPGTAHHDTAPGHIIVQEAGGMVTDVFGDQLHYEGNLIRGHVMSNGSKIHDMIVSAVQAHS